jgi:hypothetical protein
MKFVGCRAMSNPESLFGVVLPGVDGDILDPGATRQAADPVKA